MNPHYCGNVYPYTVTDDRVGRDKKRKIMVGNINPHYCGNVCPYTETDDRVGRDKKRKDNGKEYFLIRLN